MSKTTISKLFVASLVAIAGGLVLLAGAGALAYANATVVKNGPDVVAVHASPFGWVMIGLAAVAVLVLIAAAITQFIAWLAAVIHTAELEDKTWFVVLLVTGLLSFGLIAMVVYLIAGPDDPRPVQVGPATAEAPRRDWLSRSA
jgi:hypothetical protein